MKRFFLAACAFALALAAACVDTGDDPSNVRDLRVLGVRLDPPEVMAGSCDGGPAELLQDLARPVGYRALVLDPAGEGRPIRAEITACAAPDGGVCDRPEESFVLVPAQDVSSGEVSFDLGILAFTGGVEDPLLFDVLEEDPYRGLGGVRVPLVLHLTAGDEEIFALKRMLYTCRLFPEMSENVNPELHGVLIAGQLWSASEPPTLEGGGGIELEAAPFADRQETYVAPSFSLQPVALAERWIISWHADYGTIAPYETGGADFGGGEGSHRVTWSPPGNAEERDVRFWMVVRDGRGGTSWIRRTAHYRP